MSRNSNPHILMLVRGKCFPPYQGAPASRLHSFAKYWGELTQVTVVSSVYDLPKGNYRRIKFPTIEVRFDFLRLPWTSPRLVRIARNLGVDVVFVSFPLAWELFEGYLLAKKLKCPLIVDIRDMPEAELPLEGSLGRIIHNWLMQKITYYICTRADRIVTVADALKVELVKITKRSSNVFSVIQNGTDVDLFKKALKVQKEFDIVFSGKLGSFEDPDQIVVYLTNLVMLYPRVKILFISNFDTPISLGREFIENLKRNKIIENIVCEPMGPPEYLPGRLGRARLGFSPFSQRIKARKGAIGAKEFEYLSSGLPVIGLRDPHFYLESKRLISSGGAGIDDGDPLELAKKTATLINNKKKLLEMSKKARKIGLRFDRKKLAYKFYNEVILPAWKDRYER